MNGAYLDVARERVAAMSLVSLVIALVAGCGVGWWIYADRKTREHDAEIEGLRA